MSKVLILLFWWKMLKIVTHLTPLLFSMIIKIKERKNYEDQLAFSSANSLNDVKFESYHCLNLVTGRMVVITKQNGSHIPRLLGLCLRSLTMLMVLIAGQQYG